MPSIWFVELYTTYKSSWLLYILISDHNKSEQSKCFHLTVLSIKEILLQFYYAKVVFHLDSTTILSSFTDPIFPLLPPLSRTAPLRMVIAVDNSSASRKAMSHGLALASMMSSQPELNIMYAVGLVPEQTMPIDFLWVSQNQCYTPLDCPYVFSYLLCHIRDTMDRRNNMDIKEHSLGEIDAIKTWLSQFKKKAGWSVVS